MGLPKHDLGTEQQIEWDWLTGGSEGTSGATDWEKVTRLCWISKDSLNLTLSPWLSGALPQVRVCSTALQPCLVIQRLPLTPTGHTSPYPFLFPRPISSSDHLLTASPRQLRACCLVSCQRVCSQGSGLQHIYWFHLKGIWWVGGSEWGHCSLASSLQHNSVIVRIKWENAF